jgi:hypothetical protein
MLNFVTYKYLSVWRWTTVTSSPGGDQSAWFLALFLGWWWYYMSSHWTRGWCFANKFRWSLIRMSLVEHCFIVHAA